MTRLPALLTSSLLNPVMFDWDRAPNLALPSIHTGVSESNNEITVRMEIPGVAEQDIDISLENGILTIRGEKKSQDIQEDLKYYIGERTFGSFSRSFALPRGTDTEGVRANYENGVLVVSIPKAEEAKPKRIPVQSGTREVGNLERR